jgi:hypothetical protein
MYITGNLDLYIYVQITLVRNCTSRIVHTHVCICIRVCTSYVCMLFLNVIHTYVLAHLPSVAKNNACVKPNQFIGCGCVNLLGLGQPLVTWKWPSDAMNPLMRSVLVYVCMYVCMCVCVCVCVCKYVCMYICMYVCVCMCMCM